MENLRFVNKRQKGRDWLSILSLAITLCACSARPGTVERVADIGDTRMQLSSDEAITVLAGGYQGSMALSGDNPDKQAMESCVVAEMRKTFPTLVIISTQQLRDSLQLWLRVDESLQRRPSELLSKSEVQAVFVGMKLRYAIVIDRPISHADRVRPGHISSEVHTELDAYVWDLQQGRRLREIRIQTVASGYHVPFPVSALNWGIDTVGLACRELGRRLVTIVDTQAPATAQPTS